MKKLTDKEKVLKKWPGARCCKSGSLYEVYCDYTDSIFGLGSDEEEAWSDALDTIEGVN